MTITLPLQQVLIKGDDGPVTVAVSAVPTSCVDLLITPSLSLGKTWPPAFTGNQTLTHRHTGLAIGIYHESSGRLQSLAEQLAQFDWSFTDPHHFKSPDNADTMAAIVAAIKAWQTSDVDYGATHFSGEPAEMQAARVSAPAETFLRESLDNWMKLSEAMHDPKRDMLNANPAEFASLIHASVNGYIGAYLLAVLRATDPAVADQAARSLVAALEYGDTLGEWIWQWHDELTAGKPLTLWGIPTPGAMAEFASQND